MPKRGDRRSGAFENEVVSRRVFTRGAFAAGVLGALGPLKSVAKATTGAGTVFDYVVVGAGAGGGPVAAKLAKAGYKVALLEAGIDPTGDEAASVDPNTGIVYRLPILSAAAAEHPVLSWEFYVRHYTDEAQQARDSKYVPGKGILYPRGSALGGSTAHDILNWVYPHDDDWNHIAAITRDNSWNARSMRRYFERLERCEYCQPGAPGRGLDGYISVNRFDRRIFELFPEMQELAESRLRLPLSYFFGNPSRDINHPLVAKGDTGSFVVPMHATRQVRISIREYLESVQLEYPDRLFIITGALASRVLTRGRRALGVEFLQGANVYEADRLYDPSALPTSHEIYARKEVILAAGVFNTPQLLKLSGIGPAAELRAHGIRVVADVPGVGENLQDRYEVTVTVALKSGLEFYTRCLPFQPEDPCFAEWISGMGLGLSDPPFFGPYANNGLYGSRVARSHAHRRLPDLFLGALAGRFEGYFPGFSQFPPGLNWTWIVLKAHTNNTAGTVRLRSADPRQMPEINFHYFEEGNDHRGEDLDAVVRGVKLARRLLASPRASQHIASEIRPGPAYQTDEELREYIRNEAWGHHGSCTAKIGSDRDPLAVLDSAFRVRHVRGLRVVDACVFPRTPGFFPVAAIMMVGEKAADQLLEDAR